MKLKVIFVSCSLGFSFYKSFTKGYEMNDKAPPTFTLNGIEHPVEALSDSAKTLLLQLKATETMLMDAQNMMAVLTRAKNSYVQGLKDEIIRNKGGF